MTSDKLRNPAKNWAKEQTLYGRWPVGERILIGVHNGAYCAHYLVISRPDAEHATLRLQNPVSVKNADGTYSTVWQDA
jgi:hypothetical protein